MVDLPDYTHYFNIFKRTATLLNSDLAQQIDVVGSDINMIASAISAMADEATRYLGLVQKSLWLNTANGDELDYLAFNWYGITRKGASPAVTICEFSRKTSKNGAGIIPKGTILESTEGIQYVTTEEVTFGENDVSTKEARVQSVIAGKGQRVNKNKITKIKTAIWDSSIKVTNSEESAGDEDEESDEKFRERIRNFFISSQKGTLTAIEYAATTTPGVSFATAIEKINPDGDIQGVELYISDSDGYANQSLVDDVKNTLYLYRPCGIGVIVYGSTPVYQAIKVKLLYAQGIDIKAKRSEVKNVILSLVNSLKPKETLYISDIIAAIKTVSGIFLPSDGVTIPDGDVTPDDGYTIRTNLSLITIE